MGQVVSIVPTLMWLQHRLGYSALGNDETVTQVSTQKTIEFSPNYNIESTKLDTITTQSFTDIEAIAEIGKEETSTLGSRDVFHAQ